MSEQDSTRVLEEIRELLREQGARQQRAIAMQEEALASQKQAIAQQVNAVQTQRRVLRLVVPAIGGVIVAIFILIVKLLGAWSCPR